MTKRIGPRDIVGRQSFDETMKKIGVTGIEAAKRWEQLIDSRTNYPAQQYWHNQADSPVGSEGILPDFNIAGPRRKGYLGGTGGKLPF